MTTLQQKESERRTLDHLLWALDLRPDQEPVAGEKPDFIVLASGRTIGVEITAFQSGTMTDDGVDLRKVEGEWQRFEDASVAFRQTCPYLHNLDVGLFFKGSLPPRRDYSAFMEEIAKFVLDRSAALGSEGRDFWSRDFASPLMIQYLRTLHLKRGKYPVWFSNVSGGGWIGAPDGALTIIVAKKTGKQYRATDELWLAIQCNPRTSEMMMPLEGAADFNHVAGLEDALRASSFSKVFVLTYGGGIFAWSEAQGWRKLEPKPT
jgi:hypothetical protein